MPGRSTATCRNWPGHDRPDTPGYSLPPGNRALEQPAAVCGLNPERYDMAASSSCSKTSTISLISRSGAGRAVANSRQRRVSAAAPRNFSQSAPGTSTMGDESAIANCQRADLPALAVGVQETSMLRTAPSWALPHGVLGARAGATGPRPTPRRPCPARRPSRR